MRRASASRITTSTANPSPANPAVRFTWFFLNHSFSFISSNYYDSQSFTCKPCRLFYRFFKVIHFHFFSSNYYFDSQSFTWKPCRPVFQVFVLILHFHCFLTCRRQQGRPQRAIAYAQTNNAKATTTSTPPPSPASHVLSTLRSFFHYFFFSPHHHYLHFKTTTISSTPCPSSASVCASRGVNMERLQVRIQPLAGGYGCLLQTLREHSLECPRVACCLFNSLFVLCQNWQSCDHLS